MIKFTYYIILLSISDIILIANSINYNNKKSTCIEKTSHLDQDHFVSEKLTCDFLQVRANRKPTFFGCSDLDRVLLLMRQQEPYDNKVFVNAGCNKGK